MIREITAFDIEMYDQLENLKIQSKCIDKQVACIISDGTGRIMGSGVNTIIECNKSCHDKEHRMCKVVHAEVSALRSMNMEENRPLRITAYVSLFPCAACQHAIMPYVDEIVAFGMIHKDWVAGEQLTVFPHIEYTLLAHNGEEKQLSIAQGECAELVTSISDVFARNDRESPKSVDDLIDEIIDNELQLKILKIIAHQHDPELYNKLRAARSAKYARLMAKYGRNSTLSYIE